MDSMPQGSTFRCAEVTFHRVGLPGYFEDIRALADREGFRGPVFLESNGDNTKARFYFDSTEQATAFLGHLREYRDKVGAEEANTGTAAPVAPGSVGPK